MTDKSSTFLKELFEEKLDNFRELVESMYGIARFGAFTGTILFAGSYFFSFVRETSLVANPYTYLILLLSYEVFKIIRRSLNTYCEFSRGECVTKKTNELKHKSIGVRLGRIYPFKGLNKLILIIWGFLIVVHQVIHIYKGYMGSDPFTPNDFAITAILAFAISGIGLLSNAIFMVKHPGFKKFLGEIAVMALRGSHGIGDSIEHKLMEAMWSKRQEWEPLDEKKCKKCIGDLSHELVLHFPEIAEMENDKKKLLLKIFEDLKDDEQAQAHLSALIEKLCSSKKA